MPSYPMATLREFLDDAGFDWETGRVLHQSHDGFGQAWISEEDAEAAREVNRDDEIMGREFDAGYGAAECPRFVAEDAERIYFPVVYDGSTRVGTVYKDLDRYTEDHVPTPYPGGG